MIEQNDFWRGDEIERVCRCPVCGSDASVVSHADVPDYLENSPGLWTFKRCQGCRSHYLESRPTRQAIAKAYATYHTHTNPLEIDKTDNGNSLSWRLVNGYLNARYNTRRQPSAKPGLYFVPLIPPLRQKLDYFCRHLRPIREGRLLDVGCGNGRFLLIAQNAGWSVQGLEIDRQCVEIARKAGLNVHEGNFDAMPCQDDFDVVTCSHVIEHVHDPLALLSQMGKYLKAGGQIWLATPNSQGIGQWLFGKAWRGLEPPRHLQILSRAGLFLLLSKAGFENIRFLRRGLGVKYFFSCSKEYARKQNLPVWPVPGILVDLLASCSSIFSEELVVTATKPAQ